MLITCGHAHKPAWRQAQCLRRSCQCICASNLLVRDMYRNGSACNDGKKRGTHMTRNGGVQLGEMIVHVHMRYVRELRGMLLALRVVEP